MSMPARRSNIIEVKGGLAFIGLSNGMESVIDAQDIPIVLGRRWYADLKGSGLVYARSAQWVSGSARMIGLHNLLIGGGDCVDHKNGDGLDNRRANLRAATFSENARNARLRKDNTTGFKGVKRVNRRWYAQIRLGAKRIHLGSFATPEEAHAAYAKAAASHFGDFANFGG